MGVDVLAQARALLGRATTRIVYDLTRQPAVVATILRETHDAELAPGEQTRLQHAFEYSDGLGRVIQRKAQAEAGQWVGSGWTLFNNKGKPVRTYEPFFSSTHEHELARAVGVGAIALYDPVERVVGRVLPEHLYEKTLFGAWRQETWDAGDTVMIVPGEDPDLGAWFERLPDAEILPTWHQERTLGAVSEQERQAAEKAEAYAGTPTIAHLDPLRRVFLTIEHNRTGGVDEPIATRTTYDIQGNRIQVEDALDRIVARFDYDLTGKKIRDASMEAGTRRILHDVLGRAAREWDAAGHVRVNAYDGVGRPTEVRVDGKLVERWTYGEAVPGGEARNLRGRQVQVLDEAGRVDTERYDFKGNVVRRTRTLLEDHHGPPDWSAAPALEARGYTIVAAHDALDRPVEVTLADGSVVRRSYNEANLLERVTATVDGEKLDVVTGITYDAHGKRTVVERGDAIRTEYEYDDKTFRLARIWTTRPGSPDAQDLRYTYDPVGNVTHIADAAQQTVYFANRRVEPSASFTYDALARLIAASGREHLSLVDGGKKPLPHPNDGRAMGLYLERYRYDAAGNLREVIHRGTEPDRPGWTRTYEYEEASQIEGPAKKSNRLTRAYAGDGPGVRHTYDDNGNTSSMPGLPTMTWHRDRLIASGRQVVRESAPETTWYAYDTAGDRVRKVTDDTSGARRSEVVYIGDFEVRREYRSDGTTVVTQRETVRVVDGEQTFALIETTSDTTTLVRHQFGNHLQSASLELASDGDVISYEEYYPYGATSYRAARSQTEAPRVYRFLGKERDEETGLCHLGARYYAPGLGRWTAVDPIWRAEQERSKPPPEIPNGYAYGGNNPSTLTDRTGFREEDPNQAPAPEPLPAKQSVEPGNDDEVPPRGPKPALSQENNEWHKRLPKWLDLKLTLTLAELEGGYEYNGKHDWALGYTPIGVAIESKASKSWGDLNKKSGEHSLFAEVSLGVKATGDLNRGRPGPALNVEANAGSRHTWTLPRGWKSELTLNAAEVNLNAFRVGAIAEAKFESPPGVFIGVRAATAYGGSWHEPTGFVSEAGVFAGVELDKNLLDAAQRVWNFFRGLKN